MVRQAACGLDFGTSNSAIGVSSGESVSLVPLEEQSPIMPSMLFFDQRGEVTLGTPALTRFLDGDPGRMMWSIKSILGTSLMTETTAVGRRHMPYTEIIAALLRFLKAKAEAFAGGAIEAVVLGRPVRFHDNDDRADATAQQLLESAARLSGFRHVEFELEPIAAGWTLQQELDRETIVLVADIGGGTSDFTVVRLRSGAAAHDRREMILATAGAHIGGTDFDRALSLATVMPQLGFGGRYVDLKGHEHPLPNWIYHDLATWLKINFIYVDRMLDGVYRILDTATANRPLDRLRTILRDRLAHTIVKEVEGAKIRLSSEEATKLDLTFVDRWFNLDVARRDLESAIEPLIARLVAATREVIAQAGVEPERIEAVLFTGGASSIPLLQASVLSQTPNARRIDSDRFGSVASGLTIEAARRFGDEALVASA